MKKLLFSVFFFLAVHLYAQDTIRTTEGLKYVRTKEGSGELPKVGDRLKVRFRGYLPDGTIFEELDESQSFTFKLGAKEVIEGWEVGFATMRKGEKGIMIIPPSLAYGLSGVADPENDGKYLVPPDTILKFEVELIDIK